MEYAEKFSVTSQKLVLRLGLRPAPLTPDLASQTMPAGAIDHAGLHQGAEGEIGGGGVTARVGDEARGRDEVAAELGQTVDRLGQQFRLGVGLLIPGRVVFGRAQAEGAAEIHDAGASGQHDGRQFHGDFRGGGQEYDGKSFLVYGFAGTGDAGRRFGAANRGGAAGVFPVIHEDRFHVRVAMQEVDQLRAAVASIPDNSDPLHV